MRNNWTREETMLAFELYCTLPKGQDTVHNPRIRELAKVINRSDNSVKLKLQNFKSCDPSYTEDGRIGLSNASKLDWDVCNEFLNDWDSLIVEINDIKSRFGLPQNVQVDLGENMPPTAKDITRMQKVRQGQAFFRRALLASYGSRCCITGLNNIELLRASHIKPWAASNDKNEKANPQNGLLLNALHDVAFDRGLITIDFEYKLVVSPLLRKLCEQNETYFWKYDGQKITKPTRFLPAKEFIEYHNDVIFKCREVSL